MNLDSPHPFLLHWFRFLFPHIFSDCIFVPVILDLNQHRYVHTIRCIGNYRRGDAYTDFREKERQVKNRSESLFLCKLQTLKTNFPCNTSERNVRLKAFLVECSTYENFCIPLSLNPLSFNTSILFIMAVSPFLAYRFYCLIF